MNWFEIGMYGTSVNKKIIAGGIAIKRLKAIEEALSLNPSFFNSSKKNFTTSKRGMP
jgi:hypothetical protein